MFSTTSSRFVLLTGVAAGLLLSACSSSAADESSTADDALAESTPGAAARAACGDRFEPALVRYKAAVGAARSRLAAREVCALEDEVDATMFGIAREATAAVMICPAFKTVIKDSPYAEPIRTALASSLALRSLTGELLVLRDSHFASWRGVERLLPGTRYTNGEETIELGPDGSATRTSGQWLDHEPWWEQRVTRGTFRVEKTGGEKEPRRIVVELEGAARPFALGVVNPAVEDYESPPELVLRDIGEAPETAVVLSAFPSECSH